MSIWRPIIFWVALLAVVLAALVLLHGILPPFVAGMVLAYLLDRPVNRLERSGLNRAAATGVLFTEVAHPDKG